MSEEQETQSEGKQPTAAASNSNEGSINSTNSILERTESAVKRAEEANRKIEENLRRTEELAARQMLAGRADAGSAGRPISPADKGKELAKEILRKRYGGYGG